SSSDEWEDYGVAGDNYEGPPVFDDDQYEEESMPIYDTNIEDVIEEEQKFVRKGGFGGEEDNTEDVVVVANDICSSMIQTTVSILIGKKYQEEYLKATPMVDKFGSKMIKVQGRVIIKKGNLMQRTQIWVLRVKGTSEANSRTSFFQVGENDADMQRH
ncbi:hypothetical protein Tco_0022707, partial [Tanacetum coccineum]